MGSSISNSKQLVSTPPATNVYNQQEQKDPESVDKQDKTLMPNDYVQDRNINTSGNEENNRKLIVEENKLSNTSAAVRTETNTFIETSPPLATALQSKTAMETMEDESVLPLEPEGQRQFDTILHTTNSLANDARLFQAANKNVTRLGMRRMLPEHISFGTLLSKLENLQVLDLSGNNLGPQGIRALCLGLPFQCPLVSLNIADNKTDTDTAENIRTLLTKGPPLIYLDVSGNYLGKDYFSRCVGEALKTNNTLQILRAQGVGMVDAKVLLEGLKKSTTLCELDLSNNDITDRKALGAGIADYLKKTDCTLQSLALASCNMNPDGLEMLRLGIASNSSLTAINLNNNEFGSLQAVLEFVATAFSHPKLQNLHLNDAKIKDVTLKDTPPLSRNAPCLLQVLSLISSQVTDDFFKLLSTHFKGRLLHLRDVDLSNNATLSAKCLMELWQMTSDKSGKSSLQKLTAALSDMDALASHLSFEQFPKLSYLNFRKAKFSTTGFSHLAKLISPGTLPLSTLVLDGLKLAGTNVLKPLCANLSTSHVTALSFSGCLLADVDLVPILEALKSGFRLHMLKLSANRLTDVTLKQITECLLAFQTHPLSVLDLSNNQFSDAGVKSLCTVYSSKNHTSSLHSLNLAYNAIGKGGLITLLSCMGGTLPLHCLFANDQSVSFLEEDIEEILSHLATAIGFKILKSGESIQKGCSNLPPLPEGFSINLRGLGGHSGELASAMDCAAILTDSSCKHQTALTVEHVFDICAHFQNQKSGHCKLTLKEWQHITGIEKDNSIPSWLELEDSRKKAVYLSNLPGNSTAQRLQGLFENEADCLIEEMFLVKDPVTRNNNGSAWVLFSDEASVQRAMDLFGKGEAQVFGTPFSVARLKVAIEDSDASAAAAKAREDVAARQRAQAAEDQAHRRLIQQNAEESWKRHAYRLAHPAYADGRIW